MILFFFLNIAIIIFAFIDSMAIFGNAVTNLDIFFNTGIIIACMIAILSLCKFK
tara:strand:+ start:2482 stop:2643 length:162 start_codon:yes stop_codon:yes gene_type:complete